eukprot:NODE_172_length_14331_cov_0.709177.p8 type:complete len:288 gc:universal NODE_172_length_14331_cov_0.709177:5012-5875(+)
MSDYDKVVHKVDAKFDIKNKIGSIILKVKEKLAGSQNSNLQNLAKVIPPTTPSASSNPDAEAANSFSQGASNLPATNISTSDDTSLHHYVDADPSTSTFDVVLLQGDCFTLSNENTDIFNGQSIQPFMLQNSTIQSNENLASAFDVLKSKFPDGDCNKLAMVDLISNVMRNSTNCPGKPLCAKDCDIMAPNMIKCGLPTQACPKVSQCISMDTNEIIKGSGLTWWAILLIILALLIPLAIALSKCIQKKRTQRDSKHLAPSSLGSFDSNGQLQTKKASYELSPDGRI